MMTTQDFQNKLLAIQDDLLRFAFRLTANCDDAQDLRQETILKALDNQDKFAPDSNFRNWVFTIMHHNFVNNYRRQLRTQVATMQILANSSPVLPEEGENNKGVDYKRIWNALQRLPKQYSVPFTLHLQGFKYREIADKLQLPLGTVKSRIFVTRQNLQQQFHELA